MPLIQSTVDALPYIDAQPSAQAMAAAQALIHAELPSDHATTLHPSLPAVYEPKISPLLETEYARLASGDPKEPGTGIDLSRYSTLDPPGPNSSLDAWRSTLRQAYTSAEYLHSRETNLALLETYGKNAWLVGNSQLEDELRSLEREVEAAKVELEQVEMERRRMQEAVAGEVKGLESGWRGGVGRMIEVQAAGERVRGEILEARRRGVA